MNISDFLNILDSQHSFALNWFNDNRGNELNLPNPLDFNDTQVRLWTQAKGIYKPEWSDYALSIKQVIGSPYADREIIEHEDGSWSYEYHQEGENPHYWTNEALKNNIRDQVPVGIFIQKTARPAIYKIYGLAVVEKHEDGYFFLKGFTNQEVFNRSSNKKAEEIITRLIEQEGQEEIDQNIDLRERALRQIIKRRGQSRFRSNLLTAYSMRCAITGYNAPNSLEAAHINPYMGEHSNSVNNGILLRADIHTLWDLGLIWINEETMLIQIHQSLLNTQYSNLNNNNPKLPSDQVNLPLIDSLKRHRLYCEEISGD